MNRRIALVTHQFLPDFYAGTETLTLISARELRARGYKVAVFCGHPQLLNLSSTLKLTRYEFDGIEVFAAMNSDDGQSKPNLQAALDQITCTNQAIEPLFETFLNSFKPDLIHVFHFVNIGLEIFETARKHALPTVFTVTDFFSVCPLSHLKLSDQTDCQGALADGSNCLRHYLELTAFDKEDLAWLSEAEMKTLTWLAQSELTLEQNQNILPSFASQDWFKQYATAFKTRAARMRETLAQVDCLLVPSTVAAKALAANGISPFKMTFLPYGVDGQSDINIEPRGQKQLLTAAFIGQLTPHKGAHVLLEAMRDTQATDLRLKVYGDLNADQVYGQRLKNLSQADDRIQFCGTFAPAKLPEVLSCIDLLIVPSLWKENIPLIVLGAQAQGCPVIASDAEGISEVIADGLNGCLFAAGDSRALAQILSKLAKDRELVGKLSVFAQAGRTQTDYGSDLVRIYDKLLKEPS